MAAEPTVDARAQLDQRFASFAAGVDDLTEKARGYLAEGDSPEMVALQLDAAFALSAGRDQVAGVAAVAIVRLAQRMENELAIWRRIAVQLAAPGDGSYRMLAGPDRDLLEEALAEYLETQATQEPT